MGAGSTYGWEDEMAKASKEAAEKLQRELLERFLKEEEKRRWEEKQRFQHEMEVMRTLQEERLKEERERNDAEFRHKTAEAEYKVRLHGLEMEHVRELEKIKMTTMKPPVDESERMEYQFRSYQTELSTRSARMNIRMICLTLVTGVLAWLGGCFIEHQAEVRKAQFKVEEPAKK